MTCYTDIFEIIGDMDYGSMMGGGQQQGGQGGGYGMYGGIIAALAGVGFSIYGEVKKGDDAKAVAATDTKALEAVTAADRRAADLAGVAAFADGVAMASQADATARPGVKAYAKFAAEDAQRAASARSAAMQAMQQASTLGIGLSPTVQQARVLAANDYAMRMADESLAATEASNKDPKDAKKRIAMNQKAANATAASYVASRISGVAIQQPPQAK